MRSFARSALIALAVAAFPGVALAQDAGLPSARDTRDLADAQRQLADAKATLDRILTHTFREDDEADETCRRFARTLSELKVSTERLEPGTERDRLTTERGFLAMRGSLVQVFVGHRFFANKLFAPLDEASARQLIDLSSLRPEQRRKVDNAYAQLVFVWEWRHKFGRVYRDAYSLVSVMNRGLAIARNRIATLAYDPEVRGHFRALEECYEGIVRTYSPWQIYQDMEGNVLGSLSYLLFNEDDIRMASLDEARLESQLRTAKLVKPATTPATVGAAGAVSGRTSASAGATPPTAADCLRVVITPVAATAKCGDSIRATVSLQGPRDKLSVWALVVRIVGPGGVVYRDADGAAAWANRSLGKDVEDELSLFSRCVDFQVPADAKPGTYRIEAGWLDGDRAVVSAAVAFKVAR
jgi:hypothetical protein